MQNKQRGIDQILDKWRGIIKSKKRLIISIEEIIQQKIESLRPWIFPDRESLGGWTYRRFKYDRFRNRTWVDDDWRPIKVGDTWGGPDMSAYFKLDGAKIPERFKGRKVALRAYFGGDGLLRVNGKAYHGLDPFRDVVFMTDCARGDEQYDLEVESYVMWHFGEGTTKNVEASQWAAFDPEMDHAYWDLRAAFNMLVTDGIPEDLTVYLRDVLRNATRHVEQECRNFERVKEMALRAQAMAREKIYQCDRFRRRGMLNLCGNSHLDLVYLWNHAEYERKIGRTHATALRMMEEYPEYIFSQSQPQMYDRMKEIYPELYEQVKERVKEGRWEPIGAFWVEPDCNLISGESMVRQLLYGVRFYQQEFGITPHTAWIPDVFGNAWSMPQIMRKCGLKYFVTHKMNVWNDTNKWNRHVFWWEGPDGSKIFATVPPSHFIGVCEPDHMNDHWDQYSAKAQVPEGLYCYGWGDGGAGPDREMLEYCKRYRDFPGIVKGRFSRIEDALERMCQYAEKRDDLPVINDELYLEEHRGVYTTKGRLKKLNRQCELLYRQAEMFTVFAGMEYPRENLEQGWKTFLTTQFHDSLPGTHIPSAYAELLDMLDDCMGAGENALAAACNAIVERINTSGDGEAVVLFNSRPFQRAATARTGSVAATVIPDEVRVIAPDGMEAASQVTTDFETGESVLVFKAEKLPPCGYALYRIVSGAGEKNVPAVAPGRNVLENEHLKIQFNEKGEIVSLYHKTSGRECIDPEKKGNVFRLFEDMPGSYDAWDIEMHYEDTEFDMEPCTIEAGEEGPVFSSLIIKKKILGSELVQRVVLARNSKRVEFQTRIDWKERHKLLKVRFNTSIRARQATYDIAFANIQRPTTRNNSYEEAKFEVCGHQWMDLSQSDYGLSLMTDSKYGYEARGRMIGLTVLRGPMSPDPESDLEEHTFTYALQPHGKGWRDAGTIDEAADLNDPVRVVPVPSHEGDLPAVHSFVSLDRSGVTIDAIKRAEEGDDFIIRLVERFGECKAVSLKLDAEIMGAAECDLLEAKQTELEVEDGAVSLQFTPYEIKTVRVESTC